MISVGISQNFQLLVMTGVFILVGRMNRGGVHAWTYTYSKGSNLQWHEARQWCQNHFVDLVSIQNEEEAEYLNIFLPRSPKYYWIGVQKVAGTWTWVKTNEPVPVEAQRWASEEPDDLAGQDCVELYIKRDKDTAKWNNEKCSKQKEAICYAASCTRESCNAHGDCEETIGNFTCRCHPGFLGLHCEEAVACEVLAEPRQSSQLCVHPNGPNRFNSSCRFHCEVGFRLVGVSVLACLADGRWSHPIPQCEVERCPALNQTDFSLNCSHPISPFSYNSTCQFSCDDGYELVGQERVRCDHTGRWSAGTPECSVRKCPAVVAPAGGNMVCLDSIEPSSFGSRCDFTCQEGHDLLGGSSISCLASGEWSSPAPRCAAVRCRNLSAPLHGSIRCRDPVGEHSYGSECSLMCEDGFELVGTNLTKCSARGNWSHELPVCRVTLCQTVTPPTHGVLSCSHPNGPFSFGSRCSVTCEEGFVVNGTSKVECLSSGRWSAGVPTCRALTCPPLTVVSHGSTLCWDPHERSSFGSRCTTSCEDGFLLNGTADTECSSGGTWTSDVPVCLVKKCSALRSPAHGSLNCSDPHGKFSFASRCSAACDEGFVLNGTADVECSSQETWSTEPPECLAKSCPPVSSPAHGSLVCSDTHGEFSFGSRCTSACEDGFVLNGTEETNCTSSGVWSADIPTCRALTCPPLTVVSHGSTLCWDPHERSSFGSRCTTSCEDGFLLNGTADTECSSGGTWTSDVPVCLVKKCSALRSPAHGSLNCSDPHGKFSFASRCTTACDEGFVLNGTADVECSSQETWSIEPPECLAKSCPPVSSPAHGSLVCSDTHGEFSFGSRCTSACEDGFVLNGTEETNCTSSGVWSADIPRCIAQRCPGLRPPSHGSLACSDPHGEFRLGSRCSWTCERGYRLTGAGSTECTSAGTWSKEAPLCRVQQCPRLVTAPQYGRMNCSLLDPPFSFGSRCDYDCSEGFRLKGAASVTCDPSGRWSPDVPTCRPVRCAALHHSSPVSMNCSHPLANFSLGSECVFTCKDGFSLNGSTSLLCSSSGSWSDQIPTCTGRSLGLKILQYAAYGAACGALALVLFGLADLMTRHLRKGGSAMKSEDLWVDSVNPTFEL